MSIFAPFAKKPKKIEEVFEKIEKLVTLENKDEKQRSAVSIALEADLKELVEMLYGKAGTDAEKEIVPKTKDVQDLIDALFDPDPKADYPSKMIIHLNLLTFESRKSVARLLQFCITNRSEVVAPYFKQRRNIMEILVKCYGKQDASIILNLDAILRTCIQTRPLCMAILADNTLLDPFFTYIKSPTAGMDALATFKMLMTEHKGEPASLYLAANYDTFFQQYNEALLMSENFLTKVQGFQLLNELLCMRANTQALLKYVNDPKNLMISMLALKGGKAQQVAVFHVLKIFIGNPRKAAPVAQILATNKRQLIAFVTGFEKDKDDPRLEQDKERMLEELDKLQTPAPIVHTPAPVAASQDN